jgi:hypothetical protein
LVGSSSVKGLDCIQDTVLVVRSALEGPALSLGISVVECLGLLNLQRVPSVSRSVGEWSKRGSGSFHTVCLDDEGAVCGWLVDGVRGGVEGLPDCEEAVDVALKQSCQLMTRPIK